jgi:hypothetical protein
MDDILGNLGLYKKPVPKQIKSVKVAIPQVMGDIDINVTIIDKTMEQFDRDAVMAKIKKPQPKQIIPEEKEMLEAPKPVISKPKPRVTQPKPKVESQPDDDSDGVIVVKKKKKIKNRKIIKKNNYRYYRG